MQYTLIQPEEIQIRESRGLVKDVHDNNVRPREPLSAYRTMLQLIQQDPTLAAAYDIVMETATYRGFDFIRGTKDEREKLRELFDKLNFSQVLPNIIYSLVYYGDAFLELRKKNSAKPNELFPLETTEMRIIYDQHGEVEGYVQRQFNTSNLTEEQIEKKEGKLIPVEEGGDGKKTFGVFFKEAEVVHFRMKWIGSQVYSYNPNEPILTTVSTRLYAGNYLFNIFINMPPRYVAHLAGIGPADFKKAKQEFQSAKTNYKKTIAFSRSSDPTSKLELKKIDPPYDKELIAIIKWLNNEILKITRVPRTWIEESGVENRGMGESITLPYDIHIKYIHNNVLAIPINKQLLPKVFKVSVKSRFKFNECSRKGEIEILQNAGMLRNFGAKPEALDRYLDERGICGFEPTDFEEQQTITSESAMPSRQRMNKNTDNMTQNLDANGVSTSKDSTKKMKEATA